MLAEPAIPSQPRLHSGVLLSKNRSKTQIVFDASGTVFLDLCCAYVAWGSNARCLLAVAAIQRKNRRGIRDVVVGAASLTTRSVAR